jgi:hypothetical protein
MMPKKILVGALFVGLITLLVAGAVIRTHDRVSKVAEAGQQLGRAGEGVDALGHGGPWRTHDDRVEANEEHGCAGQDADGEPENRELGIGQARVNAWLTLEATVSDLARTGLTVTTMEGEIVTVERRAWAFAQAEGFSARPGDRILLTGFYAGNELEVGALENLSNGTSVQLREENGRPLWAGHGGGGA